MRLEDFIDKKVVIQPAGEHRPMDIGAFVSIEPQGIIVHVEGDPPWRVPMSIASTRGLD
jgi:hypothetical protein